jgi:outer membrane protein OmpA-like peptidoglycan-associated protein
MRIEFPFDNFNDPYKYTLTDSGVPGALTWMKEIELLAANLGAFKSKIKEISLVGNTDSSGTDDYNDRLGLRRAQFVKDQLVQRGIPAQILTVSSKGRKNPLPRKPGEVEEIYRARCRRTEISKIIRIE